MGLFDKLRERFAPAPAQPRGGPAAASTGRAATGQKSPDELAVERYQYMLRTAPPETIEQAHAEAFAKLTPQQRQQVLADLSTAVPASERASSDDPQSLARMATRAEMRQPGTMERTLGGGRGGPGMGSMIAGTLLASVAGAFIGSAIADAFLGDDLDATEDATEDVAAGEELGGEQAAEPADPGFEDFGGDDLGGDFEF
ncbi:hypothetical protein ACVGVM_18935 [Pseudonocardia bannensis]|uniref:Uncharacterized protein n=1 Tax=Pseudonocardia bannensis TaxID=630973 RepID=A0A848DIA2_9PSEU|nr:hypothetical protein [Pseudonocardia bannensis]NMH92410.1 hypothetical protein [Pseudonocardia bannensis]